MSSQDIVAVIYKPIAADKVITAGKSPITIEIRSSSLWFLKTRPRINAETTAANPPAMKEVNAAVVPAAIPFKLCGKMEVRS